MPDTEFSPDPAYADSDALAATQAAAVFDLTGRAQIEISGADRHRFLHNFCTNDINALPTGRGCEAFVCNIKGRTLGHIFVFAGPSSLWVESVAGQAAPLLAHLRRYHLLEDLVLTDRTEECGELFVSGPLSASMLTASGFRTENIPEWDHVLVSDHSLYPGESITVKRVDMLGQPGFLLTLTRNGARNLLDRLPDHGILIGSQPTFEALRIDAGFPLYGQDLTDDNLAQEAGRTKQAISFTKGCYLGQEPIARIHAMGHINKSLTRLTINSPARPPAPGTAVINPSNSSQDVGRLTSTAWWPLRHCPVALAILRTSVTTPGTQVQLATDPPTTATVSV